MSLMYRPSVAGFLRLSCALCALLPALALAQEQSFQDALGFDTLDPNTPLVIQADRMSFDSTNEIARATGSAEAFYGDRALGADVLEYNVLEGTVTASGAVTLRNDDGTYLFADDANLNTDLSSGTISQPKLLINGGAKLTAVEGERVDGRYTVLSKAVYSACEVCSADPVPLWQIRADRVIHDEVARDIIYEDAIFDVEGLPIAYLPYFRHPDPTVQRRSGFLAPKFATDSTIGLSTKLPYFLNIAPNRDLTITPFITSRDGLIMEGEYRASTRTGQYLLWGALTNNDARGNGDEWRGAVRGQGLFDLENEWYYGFDIDWASDDTFLRRYDYSDEDRTISRAYVGRQTDQLFAEGSLIYFQTFRPDESGKNLPQALPEFRLNYRFLEDARWGIATVTASAVRLEREVGLDYNRASAGVSWQRQFVTDQGLLITPFADLRADTYLLEDDPVNRDDFQGRVTGAIGVDVRMPFIAENALGTHIIEPIVQIIAAPNSNDTIDIPNEDSLDIEFDETNLFSLESRFPGEDRFESGTRANLGVRYNFEADNGLGFEAVYGRVVRQRDNNEFNDATGLRDRYSDHVGAFRLTLPPYFDITHRIRLDGDTNEISRNEVYASADYGRFKGTLGYVFVEADPLAGFDEDREEIVATGALRVSENFTIYGGARRDINDARFVYSEGGVRYENECCSIDFSVDRRFNDDRDADDGTNVGLEVRLKSLGS